MQTLLTPVCGIYTITDDNKSQCKPFVYVGQSKDVRRRWGQHRRDLKLGTHHNKHLQKVFDYGYTLRYTIITTCDEDELTDCERLVWRSYLAIGANCYNIAEPGQWPPQKPAKPIVATNIEGVSEIYSSLAVACYELNLNTRRAWCHLKGKPKDKTRKKAAPSVNGYVLKYA